MQTVWQICQNGLWDIGKNLNRPVDEFISDPNKAKIYRSEKSARRRINGRLNHFKWYKANYDQPIIMPSVRVTGSAPLAYGYLYDDPPTLVRTEPWWDEAIKLWKAAEPIGYNLVPIKP